MRKGSKNEKPNTKRRFLDAHMRHGSDGFRSLERDTVPVFLGGTYSSKVGAQSRVAEYIKKSYAPHLHPSLQRYIRQKLKHYLAEEFAMIVESEKVFKT